MHGLPQDLCKYVYFYANLQSTVCLVMGEKWQVWLQARAQAIHSVPAPFAGKGFQWMLCQGDV